jgi:hypothetical protein
MLSLHHPWLEIPFGEFPGTITFLIQALIADKIAKKSSSLSQML